MDKKSNLVSLLRCPNCNGELSEMVKGLICRGCKKEYLIEDNIPIIFRDEEVQDTLKNKWEDVAVKLAVSKIEDNNFVNEEKVLDIRTWKAVSALVKLNKESLILDLGCGIGGNILLLQKLGYSNFIATEFSVERIKMARKLCKNEILFIASNCMPFLDNVFDGVITTAVIEHVDDKDFFIKELARVLKPGGLGVITSDGYIFRFYSLIGSYRSIQPIDTPPYPPKLFNQFKKYTLELLHYDGFTAIRLFFLKSILKAIFRKVVGEKHFFEVKDKLKKRNPFSSKPLVVDKEFSSIPALIFNKSLKNLWRVFFAQQNIFVVRKPSK